MATVLAMALLAVPEASYAAEPTDSRLVEAARNQDQKAVRALLTQKVDVNARSSDGSTALLWLAHWNDLDTADLLLARGRGRERGQRLPNDAAIGSLHQRKRRVGAVTAEIGRESEHCRSPPAKLR